MYLFGMNDGIVLGLDNDAFLLLLMMNAGHYWKGILGERIKTSRARILSSNSLGWGKIPNRKVIDEALVLCTTHDSGIYIIDS